MRKKSGEDQANLDSHQKALARKLQQDRAFESDEERRKKFQIKVLKREIKEAEAKMKGLSTPPSSSSSSSSLTSSDSEDDSDSGEGTDPDEEPAAGPSGSKFRIPKVKKAEEGTPTMDARQCLIQREIDAQRAMTLPHPPLMEIKEIPRYPNP